MTSGAEQSAGDHGLLFVLAAAVAVLASVFFALAEFFKPVGKRRAKNGTLPKLPPGPAGVPILGSLPDLKHIRDDPDHKFLNSLAQYGEMATVHIGSKTWIFLNSKRVVAEIIAKRGSATNQRTPMPVSSGIISHGDRRTVLMMQEDWAEPRRVMHSLLTGSQMRQYGEWQELESTQMMAEYLFKPALWHRHHYRYANSVVHRIALGERLAKSTRELEDMQNCVNIFVGNIGTSIVDWLPELARLPRWLQPWRAHWERLEQWNFRVYSDWWIPARNKVLAGTAPPSFVRDTLLHPDTKYTGSDEDAMYVAMQLIEAGSDTTREALNILIMAALECPDPFLKARAEVDRVLGYIGAMAKEALRWHPIFNTTPDHAASKDVEFEGYYFPAGVGFVINQVLVCNECENPQAFMPERWMDGHEFDITHGLWQFGGGRRICVGYRLAQRSLFINIARLVQSFDFAANGPYNPKILNLESTGEPFPVKVTIRSEHYAKLIMAEAEKAGVVEDAKMARDKL
ncbi:cytochrome P450 [Cercophora scortea]|uniref:Cytochrome P450 n=1 Tax=Cercophora scortea TaxID=314031 RepID=A0AAE0M5V9_9PEZI|nr:cytochrome P450 [Cercophora scortea]